MREKIKLIGIFVFAFGLCLGGNALAKDNEKTENLEVTQDGNTVTGVVRDEAGSVTGASVSVVGTTIGTATDNDGRFTLRNVKRGAKIKVSFIGYQPLEIVYEGQKTLDITISEDENLLSEVVVTALGISKDSKKLGYAVSTISAGEITKVGTPNFGTALYGKASGVRVVSPPGGAASGVSFTVRGLSSINGDTQPLIVLNGAPIRSGNNEGSSSSGQFAEFRSPGIRSNGLVDINPEDIESLSILKGAAATALYGSEGANGVVLITSKKSKAGSLTIDVNATLTANTLAYLPKIQTEYGPGLYSVSQSETVLANNGFYKTTWQGTEYDYPYYATNVSFGPRYDANKSILYWDGSVRPYTAITDNPWNELFRTGTDQIYNIAINNGAENSSTRFSYTFLKETPNGLTGDFSKHNFNIVGNMKYSQHFSLDYSASYIIQKVHNRAQKSTGAYDSFSNLFNSFTDIALMKQKYQSSLGYKTPDNWGDQSLTPNENFVLSPGPMRWVRDYLWGAYKNNDYETDNRLLASVSPTLKFTDFLTAKGRLSSDYTSDKIEYKEASTQPLVILGPSGRYEAVQKQYSIIDGNAMLMFDKNLSNQFNLNVMLGWQARQENMSLLAARTEGGLTVENMFLLEVSQNTKTVEQKRMELLKTAALATIDLAFNDYLFLGFTGRQEKSSTLPKGSNTYFYPSANLSFIYTDAFSLPDWYDYGKFRLSYGIVGNAPSAYAANIVYDAGSGGGAQWSSIPGTLGNEKLKPEKITEIEIGFENKFFRNRLGVELSLYNRRISDMLLPQPLVVSDGASNMWVNIGEMTNKGVELSFTGTPVDTKDWRWNWHLNFAFNENKVTQLIDGVEYLRNSGSFGNTGGGANVRSYVGRPMGDIYVNKITRVTDPDSPYFGEKIALVTGAGEDDGFGYYLTSTGEADQEYVGNVNPKIVGGLGTTLSYKRVSFDIMTDFRIGGKVLNNADLYPNCRGLTPKTVQYRDTEHGGLDYIYAGRTMHNGWIVPGVISDGEGGYKPNDVITSIDSYYYLTYNWGNSSPGVTYELSVVENSYWKVRELSIGYDVPASILSKASIKGLTVSAFARNLFYLYKTLEDIDPESTNGGTTWGGQSGVGYSSSPTRTFGIALRATF